MGEQFRHINEQAAWFILEKSSGIQLSYVDNVIILKYVSYTPLKNTDNQPITNQLVKVYYDEYSTVYEYKLTLYDVYKNFYPEYLNPDNQNIPHEWVWSLYYE